MRVTIAKILGTLVAIELMCILLIAPSLSPACTQSYRAREQYPASEWRFSWPKTCRQVGGTWVPCGHQYPSAYAATVCEVRK